MWGFLCVCVGFWFLLLLGWFGLVVCFGILFGVFCLSVFIVALRPI